MSGLTRILGDRGKAITALVLVTLVFQASNFVFDWKGLAVRSQFTVSDVVDTGDNQHYLGLATSLLTGNGFTAPLDEITVRQGTPTYYRTPGLPLLYTVPLLLFCQESGYAISASCTSEVWWFLYILNVLFLCIGAVYLYQLGWLLTGHSIISLLGALTYIVWPSNLVFLSHYFAGTTADALVTPHLIWILYVALNDSRRLVAVMAGLVLGFCLLTRVYLVILPICFLAFAMWSRKQALKRRLAAIALVSFVVLLPWPVRNYLVFNELSLSSQGGSKLWDGNNALARGSYDGIMVRDGRTYPERFPPYRALNERYPGLLDMSRYDERQAGRIYRQDAIDWMKNNTAVLPWLLWRKLAVTFYPTNYENGNKINVITAGVFVLFVPGFVLGLYHSVTGIRPLETVLLATPILAMCAVTVLFFAEYRFRFVVEPFMILFALYGVHYWTIGRPTMSRTPLEGASPMIGAAE